MSKPNSPNDTLDDRRTQIRKLLVERQQLRIEYAYWADVYAANFDQVAADIMHMTALEGDRINEKIGFISQSILTLWGEYYDYNKGQEFAD